jgi:hypothetical protein
MKNITFVTMSQGNVKALKRTLDSFKDICNEVVYGDLCIFEEDRKILESYQSEFNLKIVKLPFNYIFQFGFSSVLNLLASHASNDLVLYNNCGEIVDGEQKVLRLINEFFSDCNCFAIDHAEEKHTWWRLYNRKELQWDGLIHEEITGPRVECTHYIFRFADTQKDLDNPFKAKVFDDIKELCYFNQYIRLVEQPELKGITNDYWVKFALDNYESMKSRIFQKGRRYEAFLEGDLAKFINDINTNSSFSEERFQSSKLIEFQNSKRSL